MIELNHIFKGTNINLTPLVTSVTWSGDIMTASRNLDVELNNTLDGKRRAAFVEEGAEIIFKWNNVELFRGVLFSDNISIDGTHSFTAHDENYYLLKNFDTIKLSKVTAGTFIKSTCAKFGVATGAIADTGYVIPKMILRDMSL